MSDGAVCYREKQLIKKGCKCLEGWCSLMKGEQGRSPKDTEL